jgi:Na+/H+ antiporter NhaD/arsenite permease-like protein
MTFTDYLRRVSLGGLLSLLVIVPLLPLLLPEVWRVRKALPADLEPQRLERPGLCVASFLVLAMMIVLFVIGEDLPSRVVPPSVAIIGASLALLVIYAVKVETIDDVMRDIDWKTLIFLGCAFALVEAVIKTGIVQSLSQDLYAAFGTRHVAVAMVMLCGVALASGILANAPVVAASILLVKGYLVIAEFVPEQALAASFTRWPDATLPVFIAMMFGGTLGGNATLIGAAANVVSAGICAANGRRVTFVRFFRYGAPIMLAQIAVSAVYVLVLFRFMG